MMKEVYIKDGPFIKTDNKVDKLTNNILISLIPLMIFAFYKNGISLFVKNKIGLLQMCLPIIFILISVITGTLLEYFYTNIIKKEKKNLKYFLKTKDGLLNGIIFALILPINTPIWLVAIGSFVATMVKLILGGKGKNYFNIPLVGKLIVVIISAFILKNYSYLNMSENNLKVPVENLYAVSTIGNYETLIKPYGNLGNFFLGSVPGAIGTTSIILCLLGFLYLIYKKAIKWRIPLVYMGTVFVMTYIIGMLNGVGVWYPLFNILTGGLVFGAIYLASDSTTSPATPVGEVIYAIFLGIITTLLRYTFLGLESVLISILIMNLFTRLIDYLGSISRFGLRKAAILLLVQFIIVLGVSLYISELKSDNSVIIDDNKIAN